ncbi:MAG: hypothetical protein K8J31_03315 [Anaerolineae bacterium]|nr:hypothetical protein [Anaerolineae bacterium]
MRRYVFSQGTVRIEDGVYRPLLNKTPSSSRGGVLLMITPRAADDPNETDTQDKENKNHVQQQP